MPLPPGFAGKLGDYKSNDGRVITDKSDKIAIAKQMAADGKKQREIAKALNISVGTVNTWLNAKCSDN